MLESILNIASIVFGSVVLLVLGGICVWLTARSIRQIWSWPKVPGRILHYQARKSQGQTFYHPVFTFVTLDGCEFKVTSNSGSWRQSWQACDSVPVRYDPQNPSDAEIQSFSHQWGFQLSFLVVVLGIAVIEWWLPKILQMPLR